MWRKMPSHMIAKCAEANALRLGFPRELAGLHIEEEVHVLDETVQTHESDRPVPITLKDRLKAQVETTPEPAPRTSQDAPGGTHGPTDSASSVHEPTTEEVMEEMRSTWDVPVPTSDDPAEPYRVKLRVCERTSQAITHVFNAVPEAIRQDVWGEYQTQLRSLSKKK